MRGLQDMNYKLCPLVGRDMLECDIPAFTRVEKMFARAAGKHFSKKHEEQRIMELKNECQRLKKLRLAAGGSF